MRSHCSIEKNSSELIPNRVLSLTIRTSCKFIHYPPTLWNEVIVTFRIPAPRLPANYWIQNPEKESSMRAQHPAEKPVTSRNLWKTWEQSWHAIGIRSGCKF